MATCNRCNSRVDPQSVDTVFGSGGALYCSPCAYILYAQQQSPDLTRAALFGGLAVLLGLGIGVSVLSWASPHSSYSSMTEILYPLSMPAVVLFGFVVGLTIFVKAGRKTKQEAAMAQWSIYRPGDHFDSGDR